MFTAAIDQRIFEDPAHAGCIRSHFGADARRQFTLHLVEIFQYPGARPVGVGTILKNDVHIGVAKLREAAYRFGSRYRQHGGGQRPGDLIFDDLRRLPRIAGFNDNLHIREIRQRIDRRMDYRPRAPEAEKQRAHHHQKAVGHRATDYPFNHLPSP